MRNLNKFVHEVQKIKLDPDKELHSYDVSALFTSVLIDKMLQMISVNSRRTTLSWVSTSLLPAVRTNLLSARVPAPPPSVPGLLLMSRSLNCLHNFIIELT